MASKPPQPLKLHQYKPDELRAIINREASRRGADLNYTQKAALSRCYSPTLELSTIPEEAFLKNMFTIFDDLFFCSSLASKVNFKFVRSANRGRLRLGVTRNFMFYDRMFMRIYNTYDKDGYESLTFTERLWDYAGTLLHEMVHAFSTLYLPRWEAHRRGPLEGTGKTFHAFLFQDIAYAVETAFLELTGKQICLMRAQHLMLELRYWPEWVLDFDLKKRWGMDLDVLDMRVSYPFRWSRLFHFS